LIFVTVMCYVFFAVRTEFLNVIYKSFGLKELKSFQNSQLQSNATTMDASQVKHAMIHYHTTQTLQLRWRAMWSCNGSELPATRLSIGAINHDAITR
jgi:hypothetical protein